MNQSLTVPESIIERVLWIKQEFPTFELKESMFPFLVLAERNTPIDGSEVDQDDDSWMLIEDPQVLVDMKPITHPHWVEDWDFEWPEVIKDIEGGVSFAFHWKGQYLAWER